MAMVMEVMAKMGCTSKLVNKNGNGHEGYGKYGCTHTLAMKVMARVGCTNKLVIKNGNGHESHGKDGMQKTA